ncbi:MAG: LytTR family DNA-binding domain-containing protein [Bacteroidota bacterium]
MKGTRAILIDDEPRGIAALQTLLQMHCPKVEVVATCQSADEAFVQLDLYKPELVFLDIAMPGKNGIALLNELEDIPFEVIFITAHSSYMNQAFRFSAVDYLLKPVDEDLLAEAVQRAIKRIQKSETGEANGQEMDTLLHNIRNRNVVQKMKLCIPSLRGFQVVLIQDIICCIASGNYTSFHFTNRVPILASKPLNLYEELLSDSNFIRAHKSHLVNLEHVTGYIKGEGGILILSDGTEVEVSRRKKEILIDRMKIFYKF